MPEVSVIIPAFNAVRTIGTALASVEAQTFRDFEIIVIDDGSSDDTVGEVERLGVNAIVLRQQNAGPGAARNTGIARARGRFVGFLDADDLWFPDKLARQLAYFKAYPQTGLLHAPTLILPATSQLKAPVTADDELVGPKHLFCDIFHIDVIINTMTVLMPTSVLREVGGFDERREIHVEDWDLWLRVSATHPVGYLTQPVGVHRMGGGMSTAFEKTYAGQQLVIKKNMELCRVSCTRHRAAPSTCIDRRLHQLHDELGREYIRLGQFSQARTSFAQALKHRKFAMGSRIRQLACILDNSSLAFVHRLKRYLADGRRVPATATNKGGTAKLSTRAIDATRLHLVIPNDVDAAYQLLNTSRMSAVNEIKIEYRGVFERDPIGLVRILRTLDDFNFRYDVRISQNEIGASHSVDSVEIDARRN